MLSSNLCQYRGGERAPNTIAMKHSHCILALTLLLLSRCCFSQGVPASPHRFPVEQELRLWSEPSSTLEELCYMALMILQQPQDSEDKGQTKRFLFHYSKTHDSGNSDFMSSVLHPLLQLVPELHERRMKKGRGDEEFQGPGGIQSRGYFMFRPRNGRRSSSFR
ncbi:neuromedin-U isoform X2 [Scyliorhinus canicula]|uniref:neuromedin-U isoform X2 n=1 Tax=Scyliorhinus canicula TaxID=7830 RepID=UPI0018F36988|nr:neuromedin-U isoform X2 [Scyliorhinus canicula]